LDAVAAVPAASCASKRTCSRRGGQGVDAALLHNLKPGKSATLAVHLDQGGYKSIAPWGRVAMIRMRRTVRVE
jgi:hypothetical protein